MIEIPFPSMLVMDKPALVAEGLEPCLSVPVGQRVTLDLTDLKRVSAFGLAALGARMVWLIRTRRMPSGSTIRRPAINRVGNDLTRMGLFTLIHDGSDRVYRATNPVSRPQELWLLDREKDLHTATNRLSLLLRSVFPASEENYAKIAGMMRSLCQNVFQHGRTTCGAILCAQAYPTAGYLEFAVGDSGVGIKESLNANPLYPIKFQDDLSAITAVMSARLPGHLSLSKPCSLATLTATAKKNEGEIQVLSCGGTVTFRKGELKTVTHPSFPGTVVGMRLNLVSDLEKES